MKRASCLSIALAAALAACGGGSTDQSTTPTVEPEPLPEPAVAIEPTQPEPAPPPEPPAPTYLHGKWVWFELNTSDVDKAKAFYGQVLGWTIEDKEMGGQKYSAVMSGGKEIALVQALPADAKAKKMTPAWMGYVSVPDVDAAVATASDKGARVVMPAMDMPEIGRFAVLADPNGTAFGVVRAAKGDEADAMPEPGQFVWVEYWGKDPKKVAEAAAFYSAVAGYTTETMKVGKDDYTIGSASGAGRMGFGKASKPTGHGRFAPYVVVASVDETVKAATKAKAKVLLKPTDVPDVGRVAVLTDPQGATFAVMTMATPAEGAQAEPEQ
jgi:uncharacterized protein